MNLFLGMSVDAPWSSDLPEGRLIHDKRRHITLAFLGNIPIEQVKKALAHFPKPPFTIGPVGHLGELFFTSRVVAPTATFLTKEEAMFAYMLEIKKWLKKYDYPIDERPFFPHVTVARAPFDKKKWEEAFMPLPFVATGIHLYESLGNLHYEPRWSLPFLPPFVELEHTADIAFHIYGEDYQELFAHALIALSFAYPPFFRFAKEEVFGSLKDVIRSLNQVLTACDSELGCPFKAVSYHGILEETKPLCWEMIVDV